MGSGKGPGTISWANQESLLFQNSQEDDLSSCSSKAPSEDQESTQESENFGFDLRLATTHPTQPQASVFPLGLAFSI